MKNIKNYCLINIVFLTSISLYSRESIYKENTQNQKKPQLSTRVGDCIPGKNTILLDVNNVRATLLNTGDMWWDRAIGRYEVPKRTQEQINDGVLAKTALFAGSIWISGKISGNLHLAALTFSSGGTANFWPGPIQQGRLSINSSRCKKFDRYFEVRLKEDIEEGVNKKIYTKNVKEWPAKGNQYLIDEGKFTAEELAEDLAPFYDHNNDGIYNFEDGDYPCIKSVEKGGPFLPAVAGQMIFWVINDVGNEHVGPSSAPIGVQLNCLAFAYESSDEFNNMTFYTYDIRNKSNSTLSESYMSQYVDCDLGNYNDDYVGCDITRALGYCVNADDYDQIATTSYYLEHVPIVGVDFFEGPKDASGSQLGMSSFVYYLNGIDPRDPSTDIEFRNYQEGKTRQGGNLFFGSDCLRGTKPTKYCFPGNPAKPMPEWSMCSAGLPQRDVRFVQNSGPFNMQGGSKETISVGVIFVQPPVGSYSGCKIDVEKHLFPADEKAQGLFDNNFVKPKGPDAPDLKIVEDDQMLFISIENKPGSNNVGESYNEKSANIPKGVEDSTYIFEAYMIFQIPSPQAPSFNNLISDNQYKLVKVMDVRNDVEEMNFYDRATKFPIETIKLNNDGIEHSFVVTDDNLQQQGQSKLINSKTYYYAAVALAFNNYQDTNGRYQVEEYIASDRIKVFSATPHNNEIYGKVKKIEFGDKIDITRVSGIGHSYYSLQIDSVDEYELANSNGVNYIEGVKYQGGKAPIDVVVTDPYKIREARFNLKIIDSSGNFSQKFNESSSYWTLEIDDVAENSLLVIHSEDSIDRPLSKSVYAELNNQLLDYGITVRTGKVTEIMKNNRNGNPTYGIVGASISFEDSTNMWLDLVSDVDNEDFRDWIRSGNSIRDFRYFSAGSGTVGVDFKFHDSLGFYQDILDRKISPYCLTANFNIVDSDSSYSSFAPGFRWRNIDDVKDNYKRRPEAPANNLDSLFSCDIVITNNRDKWSRCVVFETGDNEFTNVNKAKKGQLIQMPSVGIDGDPDGTGVGMGWFPGYAINLETGERVNISFGENSSLLGDRAANMIWDPSSYIKIGSTPVLGGSHFIYVMNTRYDKGEEFYNIMSDPANFNVVNGRNLDEDISNLYLKIIWACIPIVSSEDFSFMKDGVYTIPSDVRIKVGVEKPYGAFPSISQDYSEYFFETTKDNMAETGHESLKDNAFNNMIIVPNPYNAYSVYEQNETQNIVKIVGVPSGSTIKIYTTDGTLVRNVVIPKEEGDKYYGANQGEGETNLDNAYTWDMKTTSGILISSGVYYIQVSNPDHGEKVLKLFATMRQLDVSKF